MYNLQDILKGVKNPQAAGRELNRLYHTKGYTLPYNTSGTNIFEEDWDNLIILDACRYDAFAAQANLPGTLNHRISRGGATYEFIRANFAGRRQHDTVYVGANVWFLKLQDEIDSEVHAFINLQSSEDVDYSIEELNVPTPESVSQHARRANEQYPNKRLIVHYLQPHHPFIGPIGQEIFTHQSSSLLEVLEHSSRDVSQATVREAYRENLEIVLKDVEVLLDDLPGKTVITSDHGEMLGERHDFFPIRDYGHHKGIYNETLVKVPWHVVENKPRKKIVSEAPIETDSVDSTDVNQRLRDLGYKL